VECVHELVAYYAGYLVAALVVVVVWPVEKLKFADLSNFDFEILAEVVEVVVLLELD